MTALATSAAAHVSLDDPRSVDRLLGALCEARAVGAVMGGSPRGER